MRRLAAELGVGTMTLYGYFGDKRQLVDAAIDLAAEAHRTPVGQGAWTDQIADLMRSIRTALAAHPSATHMRAARPMLSAGALRTTEAALQILTEAGFERAEATRAYRTLFVYTFGFATFSAPADPEAVKRQTRAALTALAPQEYPVLTAAIDEAAEAMAGEAQFEFGLSVLLEGLEARRRSGRGKRPAPRRRERGRRD